MIDSIYIYQPSTCLSSTLYAIVSDPLFSCRFWLLSLASFLCNFSAFPFFVLHTISPILLCCNTLVICLWVSSVTFWAVSNCYCASDFRNDVAVKTCRWPCALIPIARLLGWTHKWICFPYQHHHLHHSTPTPTDIRFRFRVAFVSKIFVPLHKLSYKGLLCCSFWCTLSTPIPISLHSIVF